MGLIGSIRKGVRKARPAVYRLPVFGKGLRYLKRLIVLPWNFHKHYQAAGEFRVQSAIALQTQQVFLAESLQAQTEILAAHLANVVRDTLHQLVTTHLQTAVSDPVQKMVGEFQTAMVETAHELRGLNERHAVCYDRLADQLRQQTEHLRALAERPTGDGTKELAQQLAELAAAQENLAAQIAVLRGDETARLRLTA